MATRKFSVQDVVATVCDSDFGFSDADSNGVEISMPTWVIQLLTGSRYAKNQGG